MIRNTRALARLLVTAQQAASGAASLPEARVASSTAPAALRGFHTSTSAPYAAAEPAAAVAPAEVKEPEPEEAALTQAELTPRQVVEMLDRYIVGQDAAKKAVANALRNRWRRHKVPSPLREEITPKNMLMIGPTGCGKTEIARRLAKLANAPFVKVEATKFTEVGFHGRDVDQIIRDLVDNAIIMMRQRLRKTMKDKIDQAVEDRIIQALLGDMQESSTEASFRYLYRNGDLDDRDIEVEVPPAGPRVLGGGQFGDAGAGIQEVMIRVDRMFGRGGRGGDKRKMKVSEARPLLEDQEAEKYINSDVVTREAIQAVEQDGIVFIDEIDKIVTSSEYRYGADASSEGVQRDLLPIIEGSVVSTKYGNVNTDYILFICSGAFHSCKPSDMLAELQGRLPIRVELKGLTKDDFYKILTEPETNMLRQQQALLATENVDLHFTDAAIREIARVAEEVNTSVDNIGARRLHTILERILEDISYEAPDKVGGRVTLLLLLFKAPAAAFLRMAAENGRATTVIDREDIQQKLGDLLKKQDLSKYVL
ncbi:hypothetical protein N2152v2_011153 [Parachlorella kessleri]